MKSAYELAMERLAKADPAAAPLSAEQKARLAEVDRVYQGKLAEREIFLKQQLGEALAARNLDEADKIRKQISGEKARLEEEREDEKERVRVRRAKYARRFKPPAARTRRRRTAYGGLRTSSA